MALGVRTGLTGRRAIPILGVDGQSLRPGAIKPRDRLTVRYAGEDNAFHLVSVKSPRASKGWRRHERARKAQERRAAKR